MNACPPKSSNHSSNLVNEIFREKHSRHIVNRDGGKNRFNVGKPTSMIQLVGFDSGELRTEFVNDEIISFGSVTMIEDEGVAKVDGVWVEIRHRKNIFDRKLVLVINLFTKKDDRFAKIGCLARGSAKGLEDHVNVVCFSTVSLTTNDQIISKHERMNLWAARAEPNSLDVVGVNAVLRIAGVESPFIRTEIEVMEMQA